MKHRQLLVDQQLLYGTGINDMFPAFNLNVNYRRPTKKSIVLNLSDDATWSSTCVAVK